MKKIILGCLLVCVVGGCSAFRGDPPGVKTDLATGEKFNLKDPPVYLLTVHEMIDFPRGEEDEMALERIPGEGGRPVWVKEKALFHSSVVTDITPLPTARQGSYALRLKLSPRGEKWWDTMVDDHYQQKLAIALDGHYVSSFVAQEITETDSGTSKSADGTITRVREEPLPAEKKAAKDYSTETRTGMDIPGWVIIPGPFSEGVARSICENARRNYFYYLEEAKKAKEKAEAEERGERVTDPFSTEDEKDKAFMKEMDQARDPFKLKNIFD